jgi:quinol monooxygenase YgiN
MEQFFTHGRWRVKPGLADQFVQEWEPLAAWATGELPEGPWAILLRDRDDPMQFFSFGPWTSLEAIADFRARPEFGEAVGRIRPLLESMETFTLDGVARFEVRPSGKAQTIASA